MQVKLHKSQEYYIFEKRYLKIKNQGLMQTQRKELNFEGQNIFVGIDVHLKSWNVSIYTEDLLSYKKLPAFFRITGSLSFL